VRRFSESTVVQILEAHNVANKTSVKMELLNGSNAVKDQIIADANARTSIKYAFNALVDSASDGEYKGVLSDDLSIDGI
jgi:hypothetical protein